jgi:hypothetical protein
LTGEQQPASKRGPKSQIDRDEVTAFINAIHRLDSGVDNLELADPAVGSKRGKQKLLQRGRESIVKWSSDVLNELTDNQDGIQKLQQQCTPPGTGMIYSEYFELLQEIAHIQKNNKKSQALCSELIRLMNTHKK